MSKKRTEKIAPATKVAWRVIPTLMILIPACGPSEIKPVDIFPEDNCSNCRMAISDKSFASEIFNDQSEVLKFDDLGCLETFRKKTPGLRIRTIFVTDYETKQWLPYEKSVIARTGIETPMGSGKAAFSDSAKAKRYVEQFPPARDVSTIGDGCCSSTGS